MAMVSSTDFVRASERTTAIATLNRQRHLTPSCGGFTPTAERTVGPARMILESLTPRPGIREQNRHVSDMPTALSDVRFWRKTGSSQPTRKMTKVTHRGSAARKHCRELARGNKPAFDCVGHIATNCCNRLKLPRGLTATARAPLGAR